MPASTGLRARVRAELTAEIKDEARRQLAESGASGLSLRAITRALGMASSGIYRYFPSRDDLLTALIVDAYDSLGTVAEEADARCTRDDFGSRWAAVGRAIRGWARSHPQEYALVYGSPVPGYRAPQDTIGPAGRVTSVLAGIVNDASREGALRVGLTPPGLPPLPAHVAAEARRLAEVAFPGTPDEAVIRAIEAWTQLFGMVSFELFGHLEGVITDPAPIFDRALLEMGTHVGLPAPRTGTPSSAPEIPFPESGVG
jgi:AcrR family transcriptional regulator